MSPKKTRNRARPSGTATSTSTTSTQVPARKFLRGPQVKERYGFSRRTLYRWTRRGLIDAFKVNGRILMFDEAQIIALIEGSRVGGGAK